jgi:rare lipoprotein A (peptidoglycan hydrolase)
MALRRTIGISLALLMLSSGAFAKTADKSAAHHHRHHASAKSRAASHRAPHHRNRHVASRHAKHHRAGRTMRTAGRHQIGEAAWYDLAGRRTASGERMDSAHLTAAHRSLPLLSYARVTNLQNGRSVVVKINDRGPASHRFIIDLSERAAELLRMKGKGVARVEVQPVVPGTRQIVAANLTPDALGDQ